MNIETLAHEIQLDKEALRCAMEYPFSDDMKQMGKALCHKEDDFLAFCRAQKQFRLFALRLLLELAADCEKEYQRRGISRQIYVDTFRDIALWNENCKKAFQEWGIDEICWLRFHVCLEVFTLGRLSFQKIKLMEDIPQLGLFKGQDVIEVHVAQGNPLQIAECMDSFQRALTFYHHDHLIFWGESWLLNPALNDLLAKDANILRFQNIFTIYAMEKTSRQGEMRVFGFVSDHVEDYPEITQLQRNLKAYLKEHGSFGMGKGIFDCRKAQLTSQSSR